MSIFVFNYCQRRYVVRQKGEFNLQSSLDKDCLEKKLTKLIIKSKPIKPRLNEKLKKCTYSNFPQTTSWAGKLLLFMFESSPYATELDENHLERNMILTYIYKSKICLIISTSLLDYLTKCKSRFLQFIFCFRGLRCRPFRTRHVLKVLKFNILMTLFA